MSAGISLLLVEDEPLLRLAIEENLASGGFEVVIAASGQEAVDLLERPDDNTVGLVTDIRLGAGITGWEVARRAREINPAIVVVYITGDSAMDWPVEGVPGSVMLQKPFADAQLLTAVATLLNEQQRTLS